MIIKLTGKQEDYNTIGRTLKALNMSIEPAYITFDKYVELYENEAQIMLVNWQAKTIEIKDK